MTDARFRTFKAKEGRPLGKEDKLRMKILYQRYKKVKQMLEQLQQASKEPIYEEPVSVVPEVVTEPSGPRPSVTTVADTESLPTKTETLQCPSCGSQELLQKHRFCPECGFAIKVSEGAAPKTPEKEDTTRVSQTLPSPLGAQQGLE